MNESIRPKSQFPSLVEAPWPESRSIAEPDGAVSASLDRFMRLVFEPDDEVAIVAAPRGREEAGHVRRVLATELVTMTGQHWLAGLSELGHRVGFIANGAPARVVAAQIPGARPRGWWGAAPVPSVIVRIPGGPRFALWVIGGGSVAIARRVAERVSTQIGIAVAPDLVVPMPGLVWPGALAAPTTEFVSLQPAGGYVPVQFETGYFPLRLLVSAEAAARRERHAACGWICRELLLGRRWHDLVRVLHWRYPTWTRGEAERLAMRSQRTLRRLGALPRSHGGRHVESADAPDGGGRAVGHRSRATGVDGAGDVGAGDAARGAAAGAGDAVD